MEHFNPNCAQKEDQHVDEITSNTVSGQFGPETLSISIGADEFDKSRRLCYKETFTICALCNRWLHGLCYKHPLIFVQEKLPTKFPYTAFETLPPFLTLRGSTISGAGQGIFANIDLPRGVAFGPYAGVLSFKSSAERSGYSWQIVCPDRENVWIDAFEIECSNWMRFVNCARFEQEQNTIGLLYKQNIYYYTYKPIPAFTELMVWYGAEYGEFLQIPESNKTRGCKAPKKKIDRIKRIVRKVVKKCKRV